jgi:hypothetical protein
MDNLIYLGQKEYLTLKAQIAAVCFTKQDKGVDDAMGVAEYFLEAAGLAEQDPCLTFVPGTKEEISHHCYHQKPCPLHSNPTTPTPAPSAEGEKLKGLNSV